MKSQEELHSELHRQSQEVEHAILSLGKANMLLGRWMNEYGASKNPGGNEKSEQSYKWLFEYSQIVGLIDIVSDYVFESKKILEKAVYGEKENKGAA